MSRDTQKGKPARPARPASSGLLVQLKSLWLRLQRKKEDSPSLLEDPVEHIAGIKRKNKADSSEAARLKAALKVVLDRHASSRTVLVPLWVLEKALGKHGLNALDELPPEVLKRALSQLETVVSDWSQGSLAALRARLTDALIKHGRAHDRRRSSASRLSDFQDSDRLQIEEGSVSTFMEANARWQRS
ncbi:hypothetical protein ACVNIS_05025 [Sphaerotilaceae bacterium SBD11-9]